MFERFTATARNAVFLARFEAGQTGGRQIEIEHLLLGVLRQPPPWLLQLFGSPAKIEAIRRQIAKHYPPRPSASTSVDLPVSRDCQQVLARAAEAATRLNDAGIDLQHLLLGIAGQESSIAAGILRKQGITAERIQQAASAADPGLREPRPAVEGLRDMTVAPGLAQLVGRERELERILQILSRRTKNNPVLIGEAGVGKTAIVEGLARRMADRDVPPFLSGRRLLAVDASALVSPRQRARPLDDALAQFNDPANTILFVRGLFNLAATGPAWALVEAMRALDPLLAHGGMQCIATGSPAGLRETNEKAGMLARHFEVVPVAAVGEADAVRILSGLKEQFEKFHDVSFDDAAIQTAVSASGVFLPDRHLPDRAIDLIDEAAAAVKLGRAKKERESRAVTAEDILIAVAARAGMPLEAARRALAGRETGELERVAAALAAQVPAEARDWIPFLAAYLVRCSPEQALALLEAMAQAKVKPAPS